jgi:glutathione S-transferase
MKLHWSPRSPYVRKVMVCAHETATFERLQCVRSVVAMTRPNPDVMRDNPLGKIPTLVTPEGTLFGSLLICEYLDGLQQRPRMFPADRAARLQALRWHALGDGMLDVAVLWRNELLRPTAARDPDLISAFELKARSALDLLERECDALRQAPFAIGHIALGCSLGYFDFRFADLSWRDGRPAVAAWYAAFCERPSAQQTLPMDA